MLTEFVLKKKKFQELKEVRTSKNYYFSLKPKLKSLVQSMKKLMHGDP